VRALKVEKKLKFNVTKDKISILNNSKVLKESPPAPNDIKPNQPTKNDFLIGNIGAQEEKNLNNDFISTDCCYSNPDANLHNKEAKWLEYFTSIENFTSLKKMKAAPKFKNLMTAPPDIPANNNNRDIENDEYCSDDEFYSDDKSFSHDKCTIASISDEDYELAQRNYIEEQTKFTQRNYIEEQTNFSESNYIEEQTDYTESNYIEKKLNFPRAIILRKI